MKPLFLLFSLCLFFYFSIEKISIVKNQEHKDAEQSFIFTDTVGPLIFANIPSDGEYGFISIPAYELKAKLFPNLENREKEGCTTINNVIGVTHFFLDYDLTTGFVHLYSHNFFNKLRPDDYVLKFTRLKNDSLVGTVQYILKKDMQKSDVLGQNIGLFRQWKLSEIELNREEKEIKVFLKKCKFASFCGCLQTKMNNDNPTKPEIPIWNKTEKQGFVPISQLDKLGKFDGGTVVIIWEMVTNGSPKIMFQDIHGSVNRIISTAIEISENFNVDPHIALSDAGPFARKIKANPNNTLDCQKIKNIAPRGRKTGAGFGYVPFSMKKCKQ